jgi:hypothetical protein
MLERYLYIVVSLLYGGFTAYLTHIRILYIVAFGPCGIQVAYSEQFHRLRKSVNILPQNRAVKIDSHIS